MRVDELELNLIKLKTKCALYHSISIVERLKKESSWKVYDGDKIRLLRDEKIQKTV